MRLGEPVADQDRVEVNGQDGRQWSDRESFVVLVDSRSNEWSITTSVTVVIALDELNQMDVWMEIYLSAAMWKGAVEYLVKRCRNISRKA